MRQTCTSSSRHRTYRLRSYRRARLQRRDRPLRPGVELGPGPPAGDPPGRRADARAHHRALYPDPEGLLPGAGHRHDPGDLGSLAERLLRHHGDAAGPARRGNPKRSGRREPELLHRRRRHQSDPQCRPLPDHAQAARFEKPERHADHPPPARRSVRHCRHHALHAAGAGFDHRFDDQPRAISFRARRRQSRRIRHLGAAAGAAIEPVAAIGRRGERFAATRTGGQSRHRSRHRKPFRHHARDRRQCALRCVRPAHRLDDLYAVEPAARHSGDRPETAKVADRADLALSAVIVIDDERTGAAHGDRPYRPAGGPAPYHPFRSVSGDNDFVQHGARLFARCRDHGDPASRGFARHAGELHHRLPGHGRRFPILAGQRNFPDHRRSGGDVYRARRPLRELHPSDHDPVDLAVGGRRGAAVLDGVPLRSRYHRHHRHHSSDRHRQEERDHDDRLRARCRAQRRPAAARGDLPGLLVALPPHHDDNHGRDPRSAAPC